MGWTQEQVDRLMSGIPESPGVYLMRDHAGQVVYVGKAIHLRNRVGQYLGRSSDPRPFVALLSGILERIDTVVTRNEKEALILENELIKKHQPPFNILLRDDKSYLYLRIDPSEAYPRLELARRRKPDGALYFGPYHSAQSIRGTHALVNRWFGLRTCSDQEFRNRTRPCLECQMMRCLGPCVARVAAEEYAARVDAAVLFLRGRHDEVRKRLQERMAQAAESENFEEAARLRDQLKAVEAALTRQGVVLPRMRDTDAVGWAREGDVAAFAVLRFEGGVLTERVPYVLDDVVAPQEEVAESFLVQYYSRAPVPVAVLLGPDMVETTEALEEVLAGKAARTVHVRHAVRGPDGDAVRIAMENAAQILKEALATQTARDRALSRLAELAGAPRPPRRIEGFDMSTFQAAEPVGSMVVFVDGRPEKRSYRTYAVRLEEGPGDVGFMKEVLKRRFSKVTDEDRPDLVMLDGGEAQLAVAREVWRELGLSIPLVALAKSRVAGKGFGAAEHTPERLFVPAGAGPADAAAAGVREETGSLEGTPDRPGKRWSDARLIVPPQNDPGLHLLMRVRDEAHRFAVTFHRKRRAKRETASVLDGIPGLGKTRRTALLRHFGSVSAIRSATLGELKAAPGLPAAVAEAILDKLHG